jgi:FkbM family methyltransferase
MAVVVQEGDAAMRKKIQGLRRLQKSLGWRAALTYQYHRAKMRAGLPEPAALRIKPRHVRYPVSARLGGSSDMDVFNQIFLRDEYFCVRDLRSPRLILDLGANVGYASAYFLSRYPTSSVIAVEPDPANFAVCRANLAPYGRRAQAVPGAVWSTRSRLVLSRGTFGDGRDWACQVREAEGSDEAASVEAWDIPSLMNLSKSEHIDLLKVDIEGSEVNLFDAGSAAWLPKVRNICIELHGEHCEAAFFRALQGFKYERGEFGELTVCSNLRRE